MSLQANSYKNFWSGRKPNWVLVCPYFHQVVVVVSNHNSWAFVETIAYFGKVGIVDPPKNDA